MANYVEKRCIKCNEVKRHVGRNLCGRCYNEALRNDELDKYPPTRWGTKRGRKKKFEAETTGLTVLKEKAKKLKTEFNQWVEELNKL